METVQVIFVVNVWLSFNNFFIQELEPPKEGKQLRGNKYESFCPKLFHLLN